MLGVFVGDGGCLAFGCEVVDRWVRGGVKEECRVSGALFGVGVKAEVGREKHAG